MRRFNDDNQVSNEQQTDPASTFRVLCLDGGGMRGLYTAAYLSCVGEAFERKRNCAELDIGAAFNLIVGTSTGAIIGTALATGISPNRIVALYKEHGRAIFPQKLPDGFGLKLGHDLWTRGTAVRRGEEALRKALTDCFGTTTLGQVFQQRGIALAVPAVELGHHRSWVFKTPHLANTNHRDDEFTLVEVCLATTAAPLFRSLAAIQRTHGPKGNLVFADGGLWANNPVLVGLIDALEMTLDSQRIEIFCLGTCPRPAGEDTAKMNIYRGLGEWKFGGEAAKLAIDAQEFAYDHMAKMLSRHVKRDCRIVRFPSEQVPAALMPYLDLDDTRSEATEALVRQASSDADMTNSRCGDKNDSDGQLVRQLFMEMTEKKGTSTGSPQTKTMTGA